MSKIKLKKNKILLITTIITFLIIIIILCLFYFLIYSKPLNYKNILTIKIGEDMPSINDYVSKDEQKRLESKKIIWNDIETKNNKIYSAGKYSGYIVFKDKKIKLKLEVIDDEVPKIEGVEDITIYVGTEIDLLKNVKTSDNSHDKVDVKVNGSYDVSKVGEYPLSYVTTDKSGNETVKEFKLIVKEKEVQKQTTSPTSTNENVVIGTSSKGYTIKRINGIYYVNGILIANKSYNLPSNYNPGGLLSEFINAFNIMKNEASNHGVYLNIISSFRSYYKQNTLYNNYVSRDGKVAADTYSARPGHSEHQTGLAADINSLNQSWINTTEGQWLNNNCYKYGFIIRYPKGKENITGYMYEPWHIRYVGIDLATKLYNNGNWISLEEYLGITSRYNY